MPPANSVARLSARGLRVVSSEHDKLICVCRETEAEAAAAFLHTELCRPPVWMTDVPLIARGTLVTPMRRKNHHEMAMPDRLASLDVPHSFF